MTEIDRLKNCVLMLYYSRPEEEYHCIAYHKSTIKLSSPPSRYSGFTIYSCVRPTGITSKSAYNNISFRRIVIEESKRIFRKLMRNNQLENMILANKMK